MSETNNETVAPVVTDGKEWKFENDDDKQFGIQTWEGPKGEKQKRAKLSDGRIAIVKMLKGKDVKDVQRQTGGNTDKFQSAVLAMSLTVDDQKMVIEEIEELWFGDFTKLMTMATINFPSALAI